jgi:DNA modification methylase
MKTVKSKRYTLYRGNNMDALKKLKNESVDVLICDPPYGLSENPDMKAVLKCWLNDKDYKPKSGKGYLGLAWDNFVPGPLFWKEAFRVLKPGGWCLAFYGARTYDIGTLAMRLSGFEVRDCILWVYGLSSPRNQKISRFMDKRQGIDIDKHYSRKYGGKSYPQTVDGKKWDGWGTSLRPSCEPIAMCRKPLYKGSVVDNVLKYGVGALNIEASRIPLSLDGLNYDSKLSRNRTIPHLTIDGRQATKADIPLLNEAGRFPTHIIFDEDSGKILDSISPVEISRFFYNTKVSRREREFGTHGLPLKEDRRKSKDTSTVPMMLRLKWDGKKREEQIVANNHPNVKPIALMRYLVRLVAPKNAIVLDPFMGSGSTGCAAMLENCRFRGMEMDSNFFDIARSRVKAARQTVLDHPTTTHKGIWNG